MSSLPPRYVPDTTWPPYAFVPGHDVPHPVRDPGGHLFGAVPLVERIDPAHWQECRTYLRGVDLFNHGYYWEAHEVWEGIWRAFDRSETTAIFIQGLIKFAAAGVKTREGMPRGAIGHAAGAAGHFREVLTRSGTDTFCGLNLAEMAAAADQFAVDAVGLQPDAEAGPRVVIAFVLLPGESTS